MAEKNILLKDNNGNLLFPKTKAAIVINNAGDNLGDVEAGAEVNIIEKILLNGTELPVEDKSVDITLESSSTSEYSIAKQTTPDTNYAATYYLTKDGVQTGEKINIPVGVKATTLDGYGITDAYTKTEIDGMLANGIFYEEIA